MEKAADLDSSEIVTLRAESPPSPSTPVRPPFRFRVVILLLLLVPAATLFFVWGDWLEGGNGAAESLNSVAVAVLVFFVIGNMALRKYRASWTFSAGELITVYFVIATCMGITRACR